MWIKRRAQRISWGCGSTWRRDPKAGGGGARVKMGTKRGVFHELSPGPRTSRRKRKAASRDIAGEGDAVI
jgi:hypothetical protein